MGLLGIPDPGKWAQQNHSSKPIVDAARVNNSWTWKKSITFFNNSDSLKLKAAQRNYQKIFVVLKFRCTYRAYFSRSLLPHCGCGQLK